jgi:hypothetical protein
MRIVCPPPWEDGTGSGWEVGDALAGMKAKAVLSGAVVLAAGLIWWNWPSTMPSVAPVEPLAEEVAVSDSKRTPIPAPAVIVSTEPEPISPVAPPRAVPPPPSDSLRVSVRVTTSAGVPVRGAAVLVSPRGHSLNDVATTGEQGNVDVRLLATTDQIDLVVCAWHPRLGISGPWRMAANSRTTTQVDLALDETALPDLDTIGTIGHHGNDEHDSVGKPGLPMLRAILHAPAAARDKDDVQLVGSGFQSLARAQALWALAHDAGEPRGYGGSWHELLVDRGRESERQLAKPREATGEDSPAESSREYAGTLDTLSFPAKGGVRLEWLVLGSGRLDARGVPADPVGSFRFTHLPEGSAVLLASLSKGPRLPWLVATEVEPWSTAQHHELPTGPLDMGSVRLRIQDDEVATQQRFFGRHPEFQARVWTQWGLGVERCTWMDVDSSPGGFLLAGLAPGDYSLEIGSEFDGWIELGPIHVEAGVEKDLGVLEIPQRGYVDVRCKKDCRGEHWLLRRDVVETLLNVLKKDGPRWVQRAVPPGEYLFIDPTDRANGFAFTVQAGVSVLLDDKGAPYREER